MSTDPTWMAPLSKELEHSCARAHELAAARGARATGADLLLALIDDADAVAAMEACALDRAALRAALTAQLAREPRGAVPNVGFLPILHRAGMPLEFSGRKDPLTGAHVLAAMALSNTPALAEALRQHGLTRFDALRFMAHGLRKGEEPREDAAVASAATLAVKLLNDDYTPMEFVVWTLEGVFEHDRDTAVRIMLSVHHDGAAVCGTYPAALAREKRAAVTERARAHGHPLCCVLAVV